MSGGEVLWRAQWSEHADPFAHVAGLARPRLATRRQHPRPRLASGRGEGGSHATPTPARPIEVRASAVCLGNKGRDDLALGLRVFHGKFGYGTIAVIEGNKLEIDFEHAGRKRVLDSFVSIS